MRGDRVQFGLMLANRGVPSARPRPREMLEMAEIAERSGLYPGVGRRQPARAAAHGIDHAAQRGGRPHPARAPRARAACPASRCATPCSLPTSGPRLDLIAQAARSWSACTGIGPLEGHQAEGRQYGVTPGDRAARLVESIQVIQRLWTEDHVTYTGKHFQLDDVSVGPKPAPAAAPADLDRQQPEGQSGAGRAAVSPRGAPRRRLVLRRGRARGLRPRLGGHPGAGARVGPRPRASWRRRCTTTSTSTTTAKRPTTRPSASWTSTTRPTTAARRWTAW